MLAARRYISYSITVCVLCESAGCPPHAQECLISRHISTLISWLAQPGVRLMSIRHSLLLHVPLLHTTSFFAPPISNYQSFYSLTFSVIWNYVPNCTQLNTENQILEPTRKIALFHIRKSFVEEEVEMLFGISPTNWILRSLWSKPDRQSINPLVDEPLVMETTSPGLEQKAR